MWNYLGLVLNEISVIIWYNKGKFCVFIGGYTWWFHIFSFNRGKFGWLNFVNEIENVKGLFDDIKLSFLVILWTNINLSSYTRFKNSPCNGSNFPAI